VFLQPSSRGLWGDRNIAPFLLSINIFLMYSYDEIKTVHLEITERCNAACPQCGRNINGGETNQYLKNRELYLTDIKKIFPEKFLQQLTHIYMCGNYGDPIVAQDTLEAFTYFRETNPNILLSMNTNGSARNIDWWKNLAKVLNHKGHVIFSIDGLQDTNHLYRRNTNFDKIIENVKAFIGAGGQAHWEYIVFEHNEHQVEEAQSLSQQLGFVKFQIKKTARFSSPLTGVVKQGSIIKDRKGNTISINIPKNPKYKNEGLEVIQENLATTGITTLPTTLEEIKDKLNPELYNSPLVVLYDKADIDCKVKKEKNLYVSAEGIIQPCCWVASTMYNWYTMEKRSQIWKLINKFGLNNLSALERSIEDIFKTGYFNLIEESWDKTSCSAGKLKVCAKTCGKDLETFSKQYA
jgi:sulfatase maturation enzyme AslB (radical SAM superfamily)